MILKFEAKDNLLKSDRVFQLWIVITASKVPFWNWHFSKILYVNLVFSIISFSVTDIDGTKVETLTQRLNKNSINWYST